LEFIDTDVQIRRSDKVVVDYVSLEEPRLPSPLEVSTPPLLERCQLEPDGRMKRGANVTDEGYSKKRRRPLIDDSLTFR
jgi:hypothetical protein